MRPNAQASYAHLPEDLIKQMLEAVPNTVNKMEKMLGAQNEPIERGIGGRWHRLPRTDYKPDRHRYCTHPL